MRDFTKGQDSLNWTGDVNRRRFLGGTVALGLTAYGLLSLVDARYRRVT